MKQTSPDVDLQATQILLYLHDLFQYTLTGGVPVDYGYCIDHPYLRKAKYISILPSALCSEYLWVPLSLLPQLLTQHISHPKVIQNIATFS